MKETLQLNTVKQKLYGVNREYKSCLFCLTFQEKKDLLSLYNAMNDTDYQNPEELIIYTLEDAVYIGIKNDISFLVGEMLNLYEHQSTRNPNMPMRGLLYFARNYESYIEQNHLNIYGSVLLKFPLPQYFVFYNGEKDEPDRKEMELADAFPRIEGKEACLNCKATLLNINYGHNKELMDKCTRLKEYSTFIYYIRRNRAQGMGLNEAIDLAIDTCIEEDILKELLVKNRGEVRNMVLSTYNKEAYERDLREEGRIEGREMEKQEIARKLLGVLAVETIAEKTGLSVEEVQKLEKNLKL